MNHVTEWICVSPTLFTLWGRVDGWFATVKNCGPTPTFQIKEKENDTDQRQACHPVRHLR
jgi:hypothetical protein